MSASARSVSFSYKEVNPDDEDPEFGAFENPNRCCRIVTCLILFLALVVAVLVAT